MLIFERGYLEHYGRLGMKWGQHIYGDYDSRATYSKKKSTRQKSLVDEVNEIAKQRYIKWYGEKEGLKQFNKDQEAIKKGVNRHGAHIDYEVAKEQGEYRPGKYKLVKNGDSYYVWDEDRETAADAFKFSSTDGGRFDKIPLTDDFLDYFEEEMKKNRKKYNVTPMAIPGKN